MTSTPSDGIITAGNVFNLDDIRAQIAENLRTERTCQNAGKIDHAKSG